MIFVLLGTQDSPFPRILTQTEEAVQALHLTEEIYAQTGTTKFHGEWMHCRDYFDKENFEKIMAKSRLIITHGGAGTIFSALHLGKKILVLPRLAELGEHNDNHQTELTQKLAQLGHILEVKTTMAEALKEADAFTPKPYKTDNDILTALEKFIEE